VAYIGGVRVWFISRGLAINTDQAGAGAGAAAINQTALTRPQYKKSKKVWIQYHQFKLRTGDADAAKAQLSRSLQSLSRHKHVEVISKYAMSEFDFGSAERGRNVFEELLTTYPKRTDLWHLYVDKEVKLGNVAQARQLFERMITAKASARNMKAVFKKYLAFETSHGTEQTVEEVKQKARDYVSSMA
jgi:rRNA biogenesis protein RRP5